MGTPAIAGNGAATSQTLVASAGKPEFVRAVGVPGRDVLGRMELYCRNGSEYFAKDSAGTLYPLSYGVSEDEAVQQIRNTLAGGGYAKAFGRSGGATGALSASRPSAEVIDHRTGAIKSQARYDQTQHQQQVHPNQGSEHVSALKNALAGYASGGLGATDLRQAMNEARVALANPTALGADSRRYLQDFYRQGQGKLQAADAQAQNKAQAQAQARRQAAEAGDATVRKLGEAVNAFDRGAGRNTLNAALAQARHADKSGWTPAQLKGFKAYESQAGTRLWPKVNPQLAPNERALARDGAAKVREQRGQQEAKAPPRVVDAKTSVGAQAPNGQGLQGDLVRIDDRQWGLKGSTSLYRVPEHIQDKQTAIAYAKQQIQAGGWGQLRGLDPRHLGGQDRGKQTAQYLKPLRQLVDIASQEVTDGERVWDQLSSTKNALQGIGDLVFGDGFKRYDETRGKLSAIFDQVVNRQINREAASAQVKSVMAQYRQGHAKQIEGFGARAEVGAAAVQAVDSSTNLLLNATVLVGTKGNDKAGFGAEVLFRTFKDGVARKVHEGTDLAQYTHDPLSKERIAENVFGAAGNTIFLKTLDPRALVGPLLGKGAVTAAGASTGLLPTIGKAFGSSRLGQAAAAGTTMVAASVARMPFDGANTAAQTVFQATDMKALVEKARSSFPNERERELRQTGAQLERSRSTQLRQAAGEFDKAKAQQLSKLESSWNAQAEGVIASELAKLPATQRAAAEQQLRARLPGLRQQAVAQEAQAFERGWRDEQGREVYPGRARFLALAAKYFEQWKKQQLQRQRLAMNTQFDTWAVKTNTQADQMVGGIPRAVMQQTWESAKRLPIDFVAGAAMGALPNALKPMGQGQGWLQRYTLDPKLYLHETLASAVTSGAGQVVINAAEGKPLGTHVDQAIAQGAVNLPIVHNTSKLVQGGLPRAGGEDVIDSTRGKPPYSALPDTGAKPTLSATPTITSTPQTIKPLAAPATGLGAAPTSVRATLRSNDSTPSKPLLPSTSDAITRGQPSPVTERSGAEPAKVEDVSALRDTKRQALAALNEPSLTNEQRDQLTTTVRQADVALAQKLRQEGRLVASRPAAPRNESTPQAIDNEPVRARPSAAKNRNAPAIFVLTPEAADISFANADERFRIADQLAPTSGELAESLTPGSRYRIYVETVPTHIVNAPTSRFDGATGQWSTTVPPSRQARVFLLPEHSARGVSDNAVYREAFSEESYFEPAPKPDLDPDRERDRIYLHQAALSAGRVLVADDGTLLLDPTSELNVNTLFVDGLQRRKENFPSNLPPTLESTPTNDNHAGLIPAQKMASVVERALGRVVRLMPPGQTLSAIDSAALQSGLPPALLGKHTEVAEHNASLQNLLDVVNPGKAADALLPWRNAQAVALVTGANKSVLAAARGRVTDVVNKDGRREGQLDQLAFDPTFVDSQATRQALALVETQLRDRGAGGVIVQPEALAASQRSHALVLLRSLGYRPDGASGQYRKSLVEPAVQTAPPLTDAMRTAQQGGWVQPFVVTVPGRDAVGAPIVHQIEVSTAKDVLDWRRGWANETSTLGNGSFAGLGETRVLPERQTLKGENGLLDRSFELPPKPTIEQLQQVWDALVAAGDPRGVVLERDGRRVELADPLQAQAFIADYGGWQPEGLGHSRLATDDKQLPSSSKASPVKGPAVPTDRALRVLGDDSLAHGSGFWNTLASSLQKLQGASDVVWDAASARLSRTTGALPGAADAAYTAAGLPVGVTKSARITPFGALGAKLRNAVNWPAQALGEMRSAGLGAGRNLFYGRREAKLKAEVEKTTQQLLDAEQLFLNASDLMAADGRRMDHLVGTIAELERSAETAGVTTPQGQALMQRAQQQAELAERWADDAVQSMHPDRFAKALRVSEAELISLRARLIVEQDAMNRLQQRSADSRQVLAARQRYETSLSQLNELLNKNGSLWSRDPKVRAALLAQDTRGQSSAASLPARLSLFNRIEHLRGLVDEQRQLANLPTRQQYVAEALARGERPSIGGYVGTLRQRVGKIQVHVGQYATSARARAERYTISSQRELDQLRVDRRASLAPNSLDVGRAGVEHSDLKKLDKGALTAALNSKAVDRANDAIDVMDAVMAQARANGNTRLAADAARQKQAQQGALAYARRSADIGKAIKVLERGMSKADLAQRAALRATQAFRDILAERTPQIATLETRLAAAQRKLDSVSNSPIPLERRAASDKVQALQSEIDANKSVVKQAQAASERALLLARNSEGIVTRMARRVMEAQQHAGLTPGKLIFKPIAGLVSKSLKLGVVSNLAGIPLGLTRLLVNDPVDMQAVLSKYNLSPAELTVLQSRGVQVVTLDGAFTDISLVGQLPAVRGPLMSALIGQKGKPSPSVFASSAKVGNRYAFVFTSDSGQLAQLAVGTTVGTPNLNVQWLGQARLGIVGNSVRFVTSGGHKSERFGNNPQLEYIASGASGTRIPGTRFTLPLTGTITTSTKVNVGEIGLTTIRETAPRQLFVLAGLPTNRNITHPFLRATARDSGEDGYSSLYTNIVEPNYNTRGLTPQQLAADPFSFLNAPTKWLKSNTFDVFVVAPGQFLITPLTDGVAGIINGVRSSVMQGLSPQQRSSQPSNKPAPSTLPRSRPMSADGPQTIPAPNSTGTEVVVTPRGTTAPPGSRQMSTNDAGTNRPARVAGRLQPHSLVELRTIGEDSGALVDRAPRLILSQPVTFRSLPVGYIDAKGQPRTGARVPVIDFASGITLIEGDALSERAVPLSRSLHGYAADLSQQIGPAIVVQAHGQAQGMNLGAPGSATRAAAGPTVSVQQLTRMVEAVDPNGTRPVCLNSCLTGAEGESFAKAFSGLHPQRVVYAPSARVDVLEATFGDLSRFNRFEHGELVGAANGGPAVRSAPRALDRTSLPSAVRLSGRELDITRQVAQGRSYQNISAALPEQPSADSVKSSVRNVLHKLGIKAPAGASDLTVAAHQLGLATVDARTLRHAVLSLRIREDAQAPMTRQTQDMGLSFDVLDAWLKGTSQAELQQRIGAGPASAAVKQWLTRLGLSSAGGDDADVAQITHAVRNRGYLEPFEGKPLPAPEPALNPNAPRVRQEPVGRARALDAASLPRNPDLEPQQRPVARLLAAGMNYTQIGAVLKRDPTLIKADVQSALRRLGIGEPSTALDFIVAAHQLGLVEKADPDTLRYAAAAIRMREDLGVRVQYPLGDPRGLKVLDAWQRGVKADELKQTLNVTESQLQEFVRFWRERFGLEPQRGYEANTRQIAQFATDRGYFEPLPGVADRAPRSREMSSVPRDSAAAPDGSGKKTNLRNALGLLSQTGDAPVAHGKNNLPGDPRAVFSSIENASLAGAKQSPLVSAAPKDGRLVPGQVRYITTKDITPEALGYSPALRPMENNPLQALQKWSIDDFPRVKVRESQIMLLSNGHSGTTSIVKLGWMGDRPVALRRFVPRADYLEEWGHLTDLKVRQKQLDGVRGSDLLSRVGIGPQFYGWHTKTDSATGQTEIYEVTDVVPGDFADAVPTNSGGAAAPSGVGKAMPNPTITLDTFNDLETVVQRFKSLGFDESMLVDFQYYVTPAGRLMLIDGTHMAGFNAGTDNNSNHSEDRDNAFNVERLELLRVAPGDVGVRYLEQLRSSDPPTWHALFESLDVRLNHPVRFDSRYESYRTYVDQWREQTGANTAANSGAAPTLPPRPSAVGNEQPTKPRPADL